MINYKPFDGDGREKMQPTFVLPGTKSMAVTNGQARRLIEEFMSTGQTTHSAQANVMWVLLTWCQLHDVPYHLRAHPGFGYSVERSGALFPQRNGPANENLKGKQR